MEIHFVYAGFYCYFWRHEDLLRSFILKGMKEYKIKKITVTIIYMWKEYLITKEGMESYCTEKEFVKKSVNDDLEKLFEDIQLGKKPDDEVDTYFLPKLTKEELNLVERKDSNFMHNFYQNMKADVSKAEMMLSESNSKFVQGFGLRKTFVIENALPEKHTEKSIENQPPYKKARIETKNI